MKQQIVAAATFVGLPLPPSPLFAQQSAVLKGSQVTEDALVDMLATEGPHDTQENRRVTMATTR